MSLNLTLKVWRQKGPNDPGDFEVYDARDINEDMSFLEMLDVVNERLMAENKEPIAFDHDCREGICGSCGSGHQRHAPRPQEADDHLPAAHAELQERRHDHRRTVAGRIVPGDQGPGRRSHRIRPDHPGRRLHLGADRRCAGTPTRCWCPRRSLTRRLTRLPASGAARALPPARMAPAQLFTAAKAGTPEPAAPGPARTLEPDDRHGRHDGGVLRQLHELRRVRSRRARRASASTSSRR